LYAVVTKLKKKR